MPEPISLSSLAKQVTPKARIDALAAMLRSKRNRVMVVDGLAGSASAMLFTALPNGKSPYLIIANDLLHFTGEKANVFDVVIQLGAILAVVVLYWDRFIGLLAPRPGRRFAGLRGIWLLILTSLPASVRGLLFHKQIKAFLFTPARVDKVTGAKIAR